MTINKRSFFKGLFGAAAAPTAVAVADSLAWGQMAGVGIAPSPMMARTTGYLNVVKSESGIQVMDYVPRQRCPTCFTSHTQTADAETEDFYLLTDIGPAI